MSFIPFPTPENPNVRLVFSGKHQESADADCGLASATVFEFDSYDLDSGRSRGVVLFIFRPESGVFSIKGIGGAGKEVADMPLMTAAIAAHPGIIGWIAKFELSTELNGGNLKESIRLRDKLKRHRDAVAEDRWHDEMDRLWIRKSEAANWLSEQEDKDV